MKYSRQKALTLKPIEIGANSDENFRYRNIYNAWLKRIYVLGHLEYESYFSKCLNLYHSWNQGFLNRIYA